jgi:hypothetical protein
MTERHTPGPWEVTRTSSMEIFIRHPSDMDGRKPGYFAEVRRFTSDDAEVEANARLISAAPDLLAALVEIVETLGNPGTLAKAKDAIAKAREG